MRLNLLYLALEFKLKCTWNSIVFILEECNYYAAKFLNSLATNAFARLNNSYYLLPFLLQCALSLSEMLWMQH